MIEQVYKRFYFSSMKAALHFLSRGDNPLFHIPSYALFWGLKKMPSIDTPFYTIEEAIKFGKSAGQSVDYKLGNKIIYTGNIFGIQRVAKVHTRLKRLHSDFYNAIDEYNKIEDHQLKGITGAKKVVEKFNIGSKDMLKHNLSVGIEVADPSQVASELGTTWSLLREKYNVLYYYERFNKFPIMNLEEQQTQPNPNSQWGKNLIEQNERATF